MKHAALSVIRQLELSQRLPKQFLQLVCFTKLLRKLLYFLQTQLRSFFCRCFRVSSPISL